MFLILFLEIMNINILTLYSSQYFWCIVSYLLYIIEVYYILVFNFVGVSWYNKIYNLMFFDKYILPCNYPPYKDREHIYNPKWSLVPLVSKSILSHVSGYHWSTLCQWLVLLYWKFTYENIKYINFFASGFYSFNIIFLRLIYVLVACYFYCWVVFHCMNLSQLCLFIYILRV